MEEYLFNTSGEGRVLLTIGESCPSNCFNCNNRDLNKKYYSYELLKDNIDYIGNNFSRNFECLLFFTDSIYHPDILKFVNDSILSEFDVFTLQIYPKYTEKFDSIVNEIGRLNNKVVFHVCNYYLNKANYQDIKKFILNLNRYKTNFDMDLFFDFLSYKDLLKDLLGIIKWRINTFYDDKKLRCIKLEYKNIEINLYHQGEQLILNEKKYITNVYYKNCVSKDSFDIVSNKIIIKDEVMLLNTGSLTFHRNTLCSKAIKKISSIIKSKDDIIKDFIKLKNDLSQYDNGEKMGFNCYKCIKNKINYDI